MIQHCCTTTHAGKPCLHRSPTQSACWCFGRQRILRSPGNAMYHCWTPVAALTQVFIAALPCCVYVSHSMATSQPTPHGEETEGKISVWQRGRVRKTERSVSSLSRGNRPESFGPSLTAAAIWEPEVELWLPNRGLTSEERGGQETRLSHVYIWQSGVKSPLPRSIMSFI